MDTGLEGPRSTYDAGWRLCASPSRSQREAKRWSQQIPQVSRGDGRAAHPRHEPPSTRCDRCVRGLGHDTRLATFPQIRTEPQSRKPRCDARQREGGGE